MRYFSSHSSNKQAKISKSKRQAATRDPTAGLSPIYSGCTRIQWVVLDNTLPVYSGYSRYIVMSLDIL